MQPGASQWIGKPLRRLEDRKLLSGEGRFTDDVTLENEAHAAFVRSPHAHARIAGIDVSAARAAPGVLAVHTGADVLEAGLAPVPFTQLHKRPDGADMTVPPRHALTADVARFVGDAVAMVVAETRDQARDAAELVEVDWEPLPANADLPTAASADAPVHWAPAFTPEHGNIAAIYRMGDRGAADAAFAAAAQVVKLRVVNQRVVANPLEPRALVAQYDEQSGRFMLYCPTQNTHTVRGQLAKVFEVEEDKLRIRCSDLGGGFGARGYAYPEHAALCFAARALGRAVKWRADRSENFLSEVHGRDSVTEAELAIDGAQRFTALRLRTLANIGAYASSFGACVPAMSGVRAPTGVYHIPRLDHEVRMFFTNTTPVDAYRGAGRPEMGYLLERLVTRAARELKVDPIELRLKNMVKPAQMPWKNPAGQTYDCGDFPKLLKEVLAAADWDGFAARKAAAAKRGRLYGRGLACYIEITGSARVTEAVILTVEADGTVTLVSGTQQIGQGIQTSYAQIVAELLGVPPEAVRVIQGDTDVAKTGGGAGGSRSLQVGGSATLVGARALIEMGKAARREGARGGDARHRIRRGALPHRRHGPFDRPRRARREAARSAHQHRAQRDGQGADLAERLPGMRGRGRPRYRRGAACAARGGRRRRPRDEPADRRGPGARGHDAGHRAGADGAVGVRRERAAAHRVVHGLRHAEGGCAARARDRVRRVGADRAQSARRQGRGRGRLPRRDAGGGQRGTRRARRARRRRARHAPHFGESLARARRAPPSRVGRAARARVHRASGGSATRPRPGAPTSPRAAPRSRNVAR